MKVGIIGATGAVGQEMVKILAERSFPVDELRLLASSRSAGKVVSSFRRYYSSGDNIRFIRRSRYRSRCR